MLFYLKLFTAEIIKKLSVKLTEIIMTIKDLKIYIEYIISFTYNFWTQHSYLFICNDGQIRVHILEKY